MADNNHDIQLHTHATRRGGLSAWTLRIYAQPHHVSRCHSAYLRWPSWAQQWARNLPLRLSLSPVLFPAPYAGPAYPEAAGGFILPLRPLSPPAVGESAECGYPESVDKPHLPQPRVIHLPCHRWTGLAFLLSLKAAIQQVFVLTDEKSAPGENPLHQHAGASE